MDERTSGRAGERAGGRIHFSLQCAPWSSGGLDDDSCTVSAMDALKASIAKMELPERMRWYKCEKTKRESEAVFKRRTFSDPQHVKEHCHISKTVDEEVDGFFCACGWGG